MTVLNIPSEFLQSYANAASYPLNLIHKTVTKARADRYEQFLDHPPYRLCIDEKVEADDVEVHIREWLEGDRACHKSNLYDDNELAEWLGDQSLQVPPGETVTKTDPRCRFIFLAAPTGRDALWITTPMLRRILSYHQVSAEYLDYLSLFGERDSPNDLKFGNFEGNCTLRTPPPNGLVAPDLSRSGQHYEMCFNLKGVETKFPDARIPTKLDQWSIRQAAIYHKFDVMYGNAVWVITKATWTLKQAFKQATGDGSGPDARTFDDVSSSYQSSLAAHLVIAKWAGESWSRYLQCLEGEMNETPQSSLLLGDVTKGSGLEVTRNYVHKIVHWEDAATEAALVLRTNVSILQAMRRFYTDLLGDPDFPLAQDVETATKSFSSELYHIEMETEGLRTRAEYLVAQTGKQMNLALNIIQVQNSELAKRSIDEAITMRIITIVTLIYLPATFVSTFFGTDIVKYQPNDEAETYHTRYSSLAMNRWLQVTLPLTLITLVAAGGMYYLEKRPRKKPGPSEV